MAAPAVTFLLENLKQIVEYYVHLITGAKDELEGLEKELGLLRAFLNKDASNKRKKDEVFKEFERQIREVVHSAEDTIDSCLIQAAAAKAKKGIITKIFRAKHVNLAHEVKYIREQKVNSLVIRLSTLIYLNGPSRNSGDGSAAGSSAEQQGPGKNDKAPMRQDDVVGYHYEEKLLIGYLLEKKDELDVISLVGDPGQGKSTLALKISRDERIKKEFDIRIWINVSQEPNLDSLFRKILEMVETSTKGIIISKQLISHTTDLATKVHDCLEGLKFLLVLDDIWSVKKWEDIESALPKSNKEAKVLITSRNDKVGNRANVNRDPHKLRKLREDECMQLLKLQIFGKQKDFPLDLEIQGRCVALQCDGLPLKVLVMAGILRDLYQPKRAMDVNVRAWKKVANDMTTYVKKSGTLVSMSYDDMMSDDLRNCFLYLGVFPEDCEIPARTLVRLWIAEGFVQPKEEQSLEEIAEDNLKDLISRNLVTVVKTYRSTGEVKTCRVHDLIRAFCISEAAVEQQNLFSDIKLTGDGDFDPPISDKQKHRRLCIHLHLADFLSRNPVGESVRSFLCFYQDDCALIPEHISFIIKSFKLLRVLDVLSTKLTQFPIKLNKLIHLRYITLSFQDLEFLPKSISELRFLQTLIVHTITLKIEADIFNMFELRHLMTKASIILVAPAGKSTSDGTRGNRLQTLCTLSPEHCTDDVFNKARNLRKLGICGPLKAKQFDFKPLEKLDKLENLKLLNGLFTTGSARENKNALRSLPEKNSFPPNLKKLTLSATYLDWSHMSTLGNIVTLEVLKLKDNAFTGYSWDVVKGGFPHLQFLLIRSTDLVQWEVSHPDEFPALGCLVLDCEKLHEIPSCLAGRNGLNIDWKQQEERVAGWKLMT